MKSKKMKGNKVLSMIDLFYANKHMHDKLKRRDKKEILGNNLEKFFSSTPYEAVRTYKGNQYEVWEMSKNDFTSICNMTDEEFAELAGEEAWWRSAEGSNLGTPTIGFKINGKEMFGWEYCIYGRSRKRTYESLTSYFCDRIGASQPRNVCALATDLAKYNHMSMGQLFTVYEPVFHDFVN